MHLSRKTIFLCLIAFIAILITLFQHWELSVESWGYWFFARVLTETGQFLNIQRSPPYTIYLNLFRWLDYPHSIIIEYIATTFITIIGIAYIFKRYLGLTVSFLAALIWLPFMQVSEPPVQKIALIINGFAIYIRAQKENRFRICLSYALLVLAYLFRPTYFVFIPLFIVFDLVRLVKHKHFNPLILFKPNLKTDWPLIAVIISYFIFQLLQSPLAVNTTYFTNTKWFANSGKSFEFLQVYNDVYIWEKYHTYVDHDFYFTNKELFGDASDSFSAFRNNPKFVTAKIVKNFETLIIMANKMTVFSLFFPQSESGNILNFLFFIILIYGAIIGAPNLMMLLFVLGNIIMLLLLVIFSPYWRYLFPFIPLFILSSFGYGKLIAKIIGKKWFPIITAILLVLFSPNFTGIDYNKSAFLDWIEIGQQIFRDIKTGDLRILESRNISYNSISMKQSYDKIFPLIATCKGILSKENLFIGAFTKFPISKTYDIWEIPPFGYLGDSVYVGLNPNRVNCLLVSRDLSFGEGGATNHQIRYQHYIKPYIEQLLLRGAKSYDIPSYGQVVIYQ